MYYLTKNEVWWKKFLKLHGILHHRVLFKKEKRPENPMVAAQIVKVLYN
jgi:hypothetical protein